MGIRRRTFRKQYGREKYSKPENIETLWCSFCGEIARQVIVTKKGKKILSCFGCIPVASHDLPWIESIERIT